jgi:leucyl aminopeptidase
LLAKVSVENMQLLLGNLTAFYNRFFESETGAAASFWIHDTVADFGDAFPDSELEVFLFEHNFTQTSIIARFPGEDPDGPVTILGAHMDSINLDDVNGRAPGADDDGSGSVNLLEAVRVLAESGFQPKTPVEFHWYAAEEVGLLGSQDIAKTYNDTGVEVKGMLQFDMTAL